MYDGHRDICEVILSDGKRASPHKIVRSMSILTWMKNTRMNNLYPCKQLLLKHALINPARLNTLLKVSALENVDKLGICFSSVTGS